MTCVQNTQCQTFEGRDGLGQCHVGIIAGSALMINGGWITSCARRFADGFTDTRKPIAERFEIFFPAKTFSFPVPLRKFPVLFCKEIIKNTRNFSGLQCPETPNSAEDFKIPCIFLVYQGNRVGDWFAVDCVHHHPVI